MDCGWKGKLVRHKDGRIGRIRAEDGLGPVLALDIQVDDGNPAQVILRANAPDGGEKGWEWFCENFESGARWLPLGDHSTDR